MKCVLTLLLIKSGWFNTLYKKALLVATPLTVNSSNALIIFLIASALVAALTVIFANNES